MNRYEKRRQTIIARYGSWEAYSESQREAGRKGGKAKVPKGFAKMPRERLLELSRKNSGWSKNRES